MHVSRSLEMIASHKNICKAGICPGRFKSIEFNSIIYSKDTTKNLYRGKWDQYFISLMLFDEAFFSSLNRKQCCKCKTKKVYFQSIFITQGWLFFLKCYFLSIYFLFFCRRNRRAVCANNSPHLGIENRVMNMVSYRILSKCLLLNLINWESAYVWNRIHYFFKQTIYKQRRSQLIF